MVWPCAVYHYQLRHDPALCELKDLVLPHALRPVGHSPQQAAKRRAATVFGEWRRACAQFNEEPFGVQPGQVGPMLQWLVDEAFRDMLQCNETPVAAATSVLWCFFEQCAMALVMM